MVEIILVRHGETSHNKNKIIQGQLDTKLSKTGVLQAEAVANYLMHKSLDLVYCSDLGRAKQTCNIILRNHKNVPIHYDSRLRERHYGKYQGLTGSDLHKAVRKSGKTFIEFKPKSGESVLDQYSRVKDFIDELLKKHRNETILVVTHGGVMTNMLLYITKDSHDNFKKYHPPNAAITILKSTNNKTRIHKLNHTKHLKDV